MVSILVTVMSGDPTDLLETLALIVELYCHVMAGAGLPVAIHVRLDVAPSVIVVDICIDFTSFRTALPGNRDE